MLSKEQEKRVIENRNIVYYVMAKLRIDFNSSDYEDIHSIGTIGLIKAAILFDETRGVSFFEYAKRLIQNEIITYFRKSKKHSSNISYDEFMEKVDEKWVLTYTNAIISKESYFVDEIEKKDIFIQTVNIILNCFKGQNRTIALYAFGDLTQKDIGKILNITQGYVSRIIKKVYTSIREIVEEDIKYEKTIYMTIEERKYVIKFKPKDIEKFDLKFTEIIRTLNINNGLLNHAISRDRSKYIIELIADTNSFALLARIFELIEKN